MDSTFQSRPAGELRRWAIDDSFSAVASEVCHPFGLHWPDLDENLSFFLSLKETLDNIKRKN
ncbi:MAG: hypothetical protein WCA06_21940, partial [Terrimicrobiaceae bacterium]